MTGSQFEIISPFYVSGMTLAVSQLRQTPHLNSSHTADQSPQLKPLSGVISLFYWSTNLLSFDLAKSRSKTGFAYSFKISLNMPWLSPKRFWPMLLFNSEPNKNP